VLPPSDKGGGGRRLSGELTWRREGARRRGHSAANTRSRPCCLARAGRRCRAGARGVEKQACLWARPADRRGAGRRGRAGAQGVEEQASLWTGGEEGRLRIQAVKREDRGRPVGLGNKRTSLFLMVAHPRGGSCSDRTSLSLVWFPLPTARGNLPAGLARRPAPAAR